MVFQFTSWHLTLITWKPHRHIWRRINPPSWKFKNSPKYKICFFKKVGKSIKLEENMKWYPPTSKICWDPVKIHFQNGPSRCFRAETTEVRPNGPIFPFWAPPRIVLGCCGKTIGFLPDTWLGTLDVLELSCGNNWNMTKWAKFWVHASTSKYQSHLISQFSNGYSKILGHWLI